MLVFLPQASFGSADPKVAACQQNVDAQYSDGFWNMQAQERAAFGKANPEAMVRHDQHWQAAHAIDMAQRTGQSIAGLPVPPDDDPAFVAFQAKQLSDKQAYLKKLNDCENPL